MKPSIGRIVHYMRDGEHLAALIVKVFSDTCVNLQVFSNGNYGTPYENVYIRTSVVLNQAYDEATWHWPENVQTTGEVKN